MPPHSDTPYHSLTPEKEVEVKPPDISKLSHSTTFYLAQRYFYYLVAYSLWNGILSIVDDTCPACSRAFYMSNYIHKCITVRCPSILMERNIAKETGQLHFDENFKKLNWEDLQWLMSRSSIATAFSYLASAQYWCTRSSQVEFQSEVIEFLPHVALRQGYEYLMSTVL